LAHGANNTITVVMGLVFVMADGEWQVAVPARDAGISA